MAAHRVDADGLRIAYERRGAGPPVVLLHGFVGDALSTWEHQLDVLAPHFSVIAWDCPGAGASQDPSESFEMSDYADCLAAFLGRLDVERAHVVGLSFGGTLALELAARHAEIPLSLTLIGAYAGWNGSFPAEVVAQRLRFCLDASNRSPTEFSEAMVPTMFSPSVDPIRRDAFAAAVAAFHPSGFRTMARALARADVRDGLALVSVPTLLLFGEADTRAPLEVANDLHRRIPGSRLITLPGVGHVATVEAPQPCAATLLAFLHAQDANSTE